MSNKKLTVTDVLNTVDYSNPDSYLPTTFALKMINFIKLVNAETGGEEHKTPVMHMRMLDTIFNSKKRRIANMAFRGSAKTTVNGEYLILYMAVYGKLDGFDKVSLGMYVSDSIENGVKNMRKNLEHRWENSDFLQKYVPNTRFTDVRWEFTNLNGHTMVIKGYGAQTGIRGVKEMGKRPNIAILDDLLSDTDAKSPTVIKNVEDTVYKAVTYALHPAKNFIMWNGTPFNARDPLYKAVGSATWESNVFPICEKFPCDKKEFRGGWSDRFGYDYVRKQYLMAEELGQIDSFDQELMLRIMSDKDRLVRDEDINWYSLKILLTKLNYFDIYITTDFATSDKDSADFSVISVWAHNNNRDWFWIDGVIAKQDMGVNVDDLFDMVAKYRPKSVGIEISGQQGGFIPWIKSEMIHRNNFFNIAKENVESSGKTQEGFRPSTNKVSRFKVALPLIKQGHFYLPQEYKDKDDRLKEIINELELASPNGFRSLHDDFLDTVSMLPRLQAPRPSNRVIIDSSDGVSDVGLSRLDAINIWKSDQDLEQEINEVSGFSSYQCD